MSGSVTQVEIDPEWFTAAEEQYVISDDEGGVLILQTAPLRAVSVEGGFVLDGDTVRKLSRSDEGHGVATCVRTGDEERIPAETIRSDGSLHGVLDVKGYDALVQIGE